MINLERNAFKMHSVSSLSFYTFKTQTRYHYLFSIDLWQLCFISVWPLQHFSRHHHNQIHTRNLRSVFNTESRVVLLKCSTNHLTIHLNILLVASYVLQNKSQIPYNGLQDHPRPGPLATWVNETRYQSAASALLPSWNPGPCSSLCLYCSSHRHLFFSVLASFWSLPKCSPY